MKFSSLILLVGVLVGCANHQPSSVSEDPEAAEAYTKVEVVELTTYSFTSDSFFDERKNLSFIERPAEEKFVRWAAEAIAKVNRLIPSENRVPKVKLKLIFSANIKTRRALLKDVPISIIESYQEPKTNSIRLGMLELKDSQLSFQQTVAHEYTHLIFEKVSRETGATPLEKEHMEFWLKSVYEGVADMMASLALETPYTGEPGIWSTRNINEFKTLDEAKGAKASTVPRAKKAFRKMGLIPKYKIYEEWLKRVEQFFKASGGADPYAEGTWFAGALLKKADTPARRTKLIKVLIDSAKVGKIENEIESFYRDIVGRL